jgi:S-ribosylhomocysteine lyase LuxS involved in autoinducer biosynthesis
MVNYKLVYTKQAGKDAKKLSNSGLKSKALELLEIISLDPYQNPPPYEKLIGDMKKSHKVLVPVKDRPTKPEAGAENWKDYFSIILRDVGQIAIIDGKTKEIKSVVPSGFATHITRTSASGRYMYVIGRDGKASMIDMWMKEPKNVAEIQVCNDARAIDTSKHKDYLDKYAVVGCYWPPSIIDAFPSLPITHITRTGASGRYMYVIGRDGKASMIDMWMKEPKNVAEIQVCNDARAIDTSKHKDYLDKYAVVGCYWPPSIVTLEADTLDPLKIVSTGSYTYDTNEYLREARVAAIIASHDKPEWIVNIKETGQVWLYDYSNVKNPKITMVEAERFLHDGGWDLSKRYFLTAANARDVISVIDTKEGKLVKNIPSEGNKPHPGRGANVDHKTYGPLWASGHIGSNDIIFIGTDPVKHPKNAWKVVKKIQLPGEGGGNLFVKGHPNSQYIFADRPVHPDRKLQTSIYVIDRDKLEIVKTIQIPEKYLPSVKVLPILI